MLCAKCIELKPDYDQVAALFVYDDYSKVLVHKLKYLDHTELAFLVAKWLYVRHKEFIDSYDLIVPVPLHKKRLFKRKYNQALLIAKCLADRSGVSLCRDLLIKKKNTTPQTALSKEQRKKNLLGAIAINSKYKSEIIGKKILIIDDVITTGSTVNLCAKTLKKNHASLVGIGVIAKTIL